MAKKTTREKQLATRDAMHAKTEARNAVLIEGLRKLIAKGQLVLWIKQANGMSAIVDAVDVAVNGHCVQIEADRTFFAE